MSKNEKIEKKNNPFCKNCGSNRTIKKGSRNGLKRYYCNECRKSFSINHKIKKGLLKKHFLGVSIRNLSLEEGISIGTVFNKIKEELDNIPINNDLTSLYCNPDKFGGVLVVDGKYVKVKGYKKKIPFFYGIDYKTHDIPICNLYPSENYQAMLDFFKKLKSIGYKLRGLVCDDNPAIASAAIEVYPKVLIQTCQLHFLENIRRNLKTRSEETYRLFVREIKEKIFDKPFLGRKMIKKHCFNILEKHRDDSVKVNTLVIIGEYRRVLSNYIEIESLSTKNIKYKCPKNTNIIESYNKHLEGRLKTIQGFESYESAYKWLSTYVVYRRLKKFTSCSKKFKHLNGFCSLEKTLKKKTKLPEFF